MQIFTNNVWTEDNNYFEEEYPVEGKIETKLSDILDDNVDQKYFLDKKVAEKIVNHRKDYMEHLYKLVCEYLSGEDTEETESYGCNSGVNNGAQKTFAIKETCVCIIESHPCLVGYRKNKKTYIRKMTPNENRKAQGFPEGYVTINWFNDNFEYRMWGGGVALPCAQFVLKRVKENDAV